jgi:hypothetical protein
MTFGGTAEWLGKDTDFHCFDRTVWLWHGGDADERVHLNVRHRALGNRDHGSIVFKLDGGGRSASCFDCERIAVHLIDRTAHPRWRGILRKAGSCAEHTGDQCSTHRKDLRFPPHHNRAPFRIEFWGRQDLRHAGIIQPKQWCSQSLPGEQRLALTQSSPPVSLSGMARGGYRENPRLGSPERAAGVNADTFAGVHSQQRSPPPSRLTLRRADISTGVSP